MTPVHGTRMERLPGLMKKGKKKSIFLFGSSRNSRSKQSSGSDDNTAHHVLELKKVNKAIVIEVDARDHHLDSVHLPALLLQAQLPQHHLQFPGRYVSVSVLIEHLECLGKIRLLLLPGLLFLLPAARSAGRIRVVLVLQTEKRIVERAVQGLEVLEGEARLAWLDVGAERRVQVAQAGVQAEEAECLGELLHRDYAVLVLIKYIKDPVKAHGVETRGAKAEGGGVFKRATTVLNPISGTTRLPFH